MAQEQYKLVVLSTAHLEERTAEAMTANAGGTNDPDFTGFTVAAYEEGFFVTTQSAPDVMPPDEAHPSLWAARAWARRRGFMVLQLDRDADVEGSGELNVYEW